MTSGSNTAGLSLDILATVKSKTFRANKMPEGNARFCRSGFGGFGNAS